MHIATKPLLRVDKEERYGFEQSETTKVSKENSTGKILFSPLESGCAAQVYIS